MTLIACVKAYLALEPLLNTECDFKSAYSFARLHTRLKPHVEFYLQKEQELINEFSKKGADGNAAMTSDGHFVFDEEADPAEFSRQHNSLDGIEVDDVFEPDRVVAPDSISAATIIALNGFIDFIPKE